jgi:predicted GNAT family acetyltransferase
MKDTYFKKFGNNVASMVSTIAGDHLVIITHVWTNPHGEGFRGKGYASQLFDEVLEDADNEHKVLMLSIHVDPDGLTFEEVAEWYKRCGFVFVQEGDPTMRRDPQTPTAKRFGVENMSQVHFRKRRITPDYMADLERAVGFTQEADDPSTETNHPFLP